MVGFFNAVDECYNIFVINICQPLPQLAMCGKTAKFMIINK